MRKFIGFVKAAGEWGWTSVVGTAILVFISILEHVRDHGLEAYLFVLFAAGLFCWGAFKAWDAERAKRESIEQSARKPLIQGSVVASYVDAKKYLGFGSNAQEDLLQDSYGSFLVRAVNHSECPAHFMNPPRCQVEVSGRKYEGTFVECPPHLDLSVDDPDLDLQEKRLIGFFRNTFSPFPLERGVPHTGWVRFHFKNIGSALLFGRRELPVTMHIEMEDTLGGRHSITGKTILKVGRIKLTGEVLRQSA